jgi:hypothetical protein
MEIDFLEYYRDTPEYRRALSAWEMKRQWRVATHKEPTDGRSVFLVQAIQDGVRVASQIVIEPDCIDEFIEKALECAEEVRSSEQIRANNTHQE